MNPRTLALLRAAAIQALQDQDDDSAAELVSLIDSKQSPQAVAPALPEGIPQESVPNAPAHDYNYWVQFIRQHFIPFITGNGRLRFTSGELLAWMENSPLLVLNRGDLDRHKSGRTVWKHSVSSALGALKSQGVLTGEAYGKIYTVNTPQLAPATEAEVLFEPFGIQ